MPIVLAYSPSTLPATLIALAPTFGAGYQAFDANGVPLNAGQIYTYAAGTTTPVGTYTTSGGTTQNANPIILGADGRPPDEIWLDGSQTYKFVLEDSLGNVIDTYDNIPGISAAQYFTNQLLQIVSVGGTANAITGNTSPTIAFSAGQLFSITPLTTNTGATTAALNGGAALALHFNGAACVGGELQANVPSIWQYDGTQFNILSAIGPAFSDGLALVKNASDATKKLVFSASLLTTGTTRTITAPDRNINLGLKVVRQVFTASGTYTPTSGMVYADVELQAAGGSGGGCAASVYAGASGGSAGGYVRQMMSAATIGASQTVTLGAAGAAPSAGANNGNAAADSTFGALLTAKGGAGGNAGASGTVSAGVDRVSGTSAGDYSIDGGSSGPGIGGSASVPTMSGIGGDSQLGRGGRSQALYSGNAGGIAGTGYGAGGAGALNANTASAVAGAAGQSAICIVTEYVAG